MAVTWRSSGTSEEYEAAIRAAMDRFLAGPTGRSVNPSSIHEPSRTRGAFPATSIEVTFRVADQRGRPDCRFGWRTRLWTDTGNPLHYWSKREPLWEEIGYALASLLVEEVETTPGLPPECRADPDGVTWMRRDA